ncbi:DNA translocase FtsK 4TM domain-containing protein [Pseudooceanicola sp. CBS1P-1]|uniref:DNA translocase FtsK n=1 Tax=Pseudooceanicola albus TaxID=2692189 RepID=A0A6L7GAD0_9RHOB|nr:MULTISPECIES: DNA translocase FtsK [Pseudooceanicola]MBT9386689.1 DNA translocase FtsK 4TM domain-containing protein [Pseudooceanicola endophyticus]MXN20899.1 cell division protein FtsK [Pseudooceanicola albus]
MAFQSKGRDPLFDSSVRETLERRGRELIGIAALVFGLVFAVLILSYAPQDPSWMSSSDAPVQNWLGQFGASIAAPVMMILGYGAVTIAGFALVWGARYTIHLAENGPVNRLIFSPIAVVLASIYFGTLTPPHGWGGGFGLGGLFGDTVLGALLLVIPLPVGASVKLLSLIVGLGAGAMFLYVAGFTREEGRRLFRLALIGLVMAYVLVLKLAGRGATGALGAASSAVERRRERARSRDALAAVHEDADAVVWDDEDWDVEGSSDPEADRYWAERAAQQAEERTARPSRVLRAERPEAPAVPAYRPEPAVASGAAWQQPEPEEAHAYAEEPYEDDYDDYAEPEPEQPQRGGLLSRLPGFSRRSSPSEAPAAFEHDDEFDDDDRIKAKIANVVRSRAGRGGMASRSLVPPAPPVSNSARAVRPRGPAPLILPERREPPLHAQPRSEPPLSAPPAAARAAVPPAPEAYRSAPVAQAPVAPQAAVVPPAPSFLQTEPAGYGAPEAPQATPEFDLRGGQDAYEVFEDSRSWDEAPEADHFVPPEEPPLYASRPDVSFVPEDPEDDLPPRPLLRDETAGDFRPETFEEEDDDEDGYMPQGMGQPVTPAAPVVPQAPRVAPPAPSPAARRPVETVARASVATSPRASLEQRAPAGITTSIADDYELPPLHLLSSPDSIQRHYLSDDALEENARMLESVLDDYGVKGEIVSVRPGPVVTMYELEPAPGLKASRVIGLADDIARSMSALSARVSTVPGRSVIGIELPNENREMVVLREILAARDFGDTAKKLPLALGKDISGEAVVANLAKMPHLLIAGTTGSGKSVAINTMILSLLYRLTPEDCRLIMIDPKMLELSVYDGIPHLLSPVVTDPKKAVVALKWVVGEMEERYRKMSKMGVRNIDGYNSRVQETLDRGEMFSRTVQTGFDEETGDPVFETEEIQPVKMPYIVVIVDEMADLMMVAGKEIEACIQRLAQMARASGIHLIMATQRPSVDVITGTIKANFPTRISFQVTSKIDSRTILGEMGAEQLLGMGDMLYMAGGSRITRCHGPFVSDEEVEEVVNHLKAFGPPDYIGGVVEGPDDDKADDIDAVLGLNTGGNTGGEDALYDQAVAIVIKDRKCSTSYIQRKLAIGYNKAARLVEQMEDEGVVSPANHVGKREVLVPEPQ